MRNNIVFSSGVLIALFAGAPAFAQDFNGPYVGVQGGWEQTDVRNPETDLGTLPIDSHNESFTGGVFAGYDQQVAPRVVVGVEGGMDFSADDEVETTTGLGLVSVDPKWSLDLTARAGYLVNPTTLAYVRGGYTNARVDTTLTNASMELSEEENRDGWLVGAGVERKLVQNISARLEYRYSDLSEGEGNYDRHRVLAGLAYRF